LETEIAGLKVIPTSVENAVTDPNPIAEEGKKPSVANELLKDFVNNLTISQKSKFM